MQFYVGLDVSLKRPEICVVEETGRMLWRSVADMHPGMIAEKPGRWRAGLARVGLETGSMTPLAGTQSSGKSGDARYAESALPAPPPVS